MEKFYLLFGSQDGDKSALLQEIKKRFGVNEAYTLLGEFMKANNIEFSKFTYT